MSKFSFISAQAKALSSWVFIDKNITVIQDDLKCNLFTINIEVFIFLKEIINRYQLMLSKTLYWVNKRYN